MISYEIWVLNKKGKLQMQKSFNSLDEAIEELKRWHEFKVTHVQLRIVREVNPL